MYKLVTALFIIISAICFSVDTPSLDHTWLVSTTSGNDTNAGKATTYPYTLTGVADATISASITAASAGDTIIVFPGTYDENVAISKTLNIYFVNATITRDADDTSAAVSCTADDCYVQGLRVTSVQNGTGEHALTITGSRNTFENVYITLSGTGSLTTQHGINISTGTHNTLNKAHVVFGGTRTSLQFGLFMSSSYNTITNSYLSSTSTSVVSAQGALYSTFRNCVFENKANTNAVQYCATFITGTILDGCKFLSNSTGSGNTGVNARYGLSDSGNNIVSNCVFNIQTGTDDAGVAACIYGGGLNSVFINNTAYALSASAAEYTFYMNTNCSCTIIGTNVDATKIYGTVYYAPSNVLQSSNTTPIAITDIIKAGGGAIDTTPSGKVRISAGSAYGN